jgi:hypothetical protein
VSAKTTADALWSECVRARDRQCRRCGLAGRPNHRGLRVIGLEAAHILRRGLGHTRTDERNGLALCSVDAKFFTEHPLEWEPFVIDQIGYDLLRTLRLKARNTAHVDWDAEVSRLTQIHDRLLAAA